MIRSKIHNPIGLKTKQNGVGLIEVLVTVFVLSVGLLGVAALLTSGLRASEGSLVRSKANELAYGIIERMYNRAPDARCNLYNITLAAPAPAAAPGVPGDLNWWKTRLAADLPGGLGSIACAPVPAAPTPCATRAIATCTITVQWDDTRAGGGATEQYSVVMRP